MIKLKRAYEKASADDGYRVLVDRLWPRGVSRRPARIDLWLKDIAPSTALRTWFGHDPARWQTFRRRYSAELRRVPDGIAQLRELARERSVKFVYGAKDTEHTHALVLKDFIEKAAALRKPPAKTKKR